MAIKEKQYRPDVSHAAGSPECKLRTGEIEAKDFV